MRTTLKHTLAACIALGALMLTGTACTQDDPLGGNNPAGTQLLQLGKVTIAGAETATRSADAATRSADADGFIGIRKTQFVKNDKLVLTLNDGKGNPNSSTEVTATLSTDGTTWTLDPVKTYFTPGTTVSATHTPTRMTTSGSSGLECRDVLVTAQPVELKADGTKATLTLTHANAMVEVTPPASLTAAGTTYKDLTIYATRSGATDAQALSHFTEGTGTNLRHRTIAPVGATLNSVSLKVNGITYTTTIAGTPTLEANKRYPITLTITGDKLVASVAAGTSWEVGGEVEGHPTGRTRYISTPQDLQQLAADVKAGTANGTDVTVLQTADIDMTGITNWEPIGTEYTLSFQGSYNGNGYSISNLKMGGTYATNTSPMMGLFGYIAGAKITGVHLRDCTITTTGGHTIYAGALAAYATANCIVTLCSATGSITATGSTQAHVGGLVGRLYSGGAAMPNHFTRCTANVAVTVDATNADSYIGAFAGLSAHAHFVGCIASGKVTKQNAGYSSGFSNAVANAAASSNYHAMGCITNSQIVNTNNDATYAFGDITSIRSCLATQPSYDYFYAANSITATDNVSLGLLTTTRPGATPFVSYADARGLLTKANAASPIKIKTLHYSPTDGYTTDVVERYWFAKGIWKDNGNDLPTIDMSYEGTINPEPITAGNNVYPVNGYWVTAPDTDELKQYVWNANLDATAMTTNPCATTAAVAKGWQMPFIKDMQEMAGWTGIHDWSQSVSASTRVAVTAEFLTAFPAGEMYWSVTIGAAPSTALNCAWAISVEGSQARYTPQGKESDNRIRCVQLQKAMP